jgi:hypothetical protein
VKDAKVREGIRIPILPAREPGKRLPLPGDLTPFLVPSAAEYFASVIKAIPMVI